MAAACVNPRLFRHRTTFAYWVAACTRWVCPGCIRKVAWRWRQILNWAAAQGAPAEYLITLALREPLPLWRQAPADQQEALKEQARGVATLLTLALTRLVAEIRDQHGPFEYLAVVELTTGTRTPGHRPHLHLLARGPRLAARWLSERWRFHTKGSFKVDIQRLRCPQQAGDYLIGYAVAARKQTQRAHLGDWPGPRIRYSRGFFPQPVPQIRALLWPPSDPGMWEYLCAADTDWQLIWLWAASDGMPLQSEAVTGLVPTKCRKGARANAANHAVEARPAAGVCPGSGILATVAVTQIAGRPAPGLSSHCKQGGAA